jgi:LDH2 family malate/lactate/ureidoglycolate dehydrogenase
MGNSTGKIDGIIYAPSAELLLHDSGGDTGGGIALITDLIVGTLVDQTATLSLQSYTQSTPGSPLTKVMLVE